MKRKFHFPKSMSKSQKKAELKKHRKPPIPPAIVSDSKAEFERKQLRKFKQKLRKEAEDYE